jgi:kynureninase
MISVTSARARKHFAGLERNTWLVSHSMGAPPKAAADALATYYAEWADGGPDGAWPGWLDRICTIGDGIGAIIGAPRGSVSLAPNVSLLQSAIASSRDPRSARNEIVYEALQFPSLAYVWTAWERAGAKAVRVPTDDGRTIPTDRICAAITERTALVVLSHAYYQSAVLIDLPPIVARAHEMGALVVLDAYQTTGIVPYDVVELDLDLVVGGSHKWLCGGPGCGWIYVKPALAPRFRPMTTGWFAHRDPFAFEPPPIEYARNQLRWASGTPTIPGYVVAQAGHDIIREIGVPAIREHNARLTRQLTDAALERGWPVSTPLDPALRTGWIGIDVPEAARIQEALRERRIFVDHRPGCGLRVSAHAYTTDEEIERFVTAMDALVKL